MSSVLIARYIVSCSWIYHGLFPKLIHIAPTEKLMTVSMGFSDAISCIITKTAGFAEVIFGLLIFIFYRSKPIIALNIFVLLVLLLYVGLVQP